jgi:thioredoxin-like negative regulator of GroEL
MQSKRSNTDPGPNREQLLQMAIASAKKGNADGARMMLRQILSEDRRNERALLWMAKLARTKKERLEWLERVLDANPDNEQARKQKRRMEYVNSAQQNRTLLIFGVVAGVLVVLGIVVFVALQLG